MEIPNRRGIPGMLLLWSLCCVTVCSPQPLRGRLHGRGYLRAADVRRQCQSVLSSASELTTTRSDASSLMSGLPDADWHQDAGDAPLMPLPVPDPAGTLLEEATTRLATLTLTHVDTVMDVQGQRGRLALNVSGVLSLTIISHNGGCCCSAGSSKYDDSMDPHRRVSPEFKLRPGVSKLDIMLEGVYTETKSSSGERVLCMVGDALLPVRGSNSNSNITAGPWDWTKNNVGGSSEPPVMADGNIVFTLRFAKWQTLTTRAMLGELMSTSAKSDQAYFDTVRLVSHGNHFSSDGYRYRPREELAAAAASGCSMRPFFCDGDDDEVSAGNNNNNCAGELSEDVPVCDILRAGEYGVLAVVPNWKCHSKSTDDSDEEFCSLLGPFVDNGAGRAVNTTGRAFTDFAIAAQGIRCTGLDANGTAQVSAVFRAVAPWEDRLGAVRRTGLSGMTLSAEGVWSASTRRLCMVACLGTGDKACQHRVSLFFPTTFSLTRRGVVVGQITSTDGSYFPLSFQRALDPGQMWNKASRPDEPLRMAYDYTKIGQAMELLIRSSKRSRLSSSLVAMSLISYPIPTKRAGTADDDDDATGILTEDLGLNFRVVGPKPQQGLPGWIKGQFFQLQILSIGPLVRSKVHYRFDEGFQLQSTGRSGMQLQRGVQNGMDHTGGVEVQQQILNVSAAFAVSSRSPSGWHRPVILLEGVYNPSDGRMHLIGCRDVEAPWRVLSKTRGLENGMDCSMEVKVEYPPTTMRWLFSPAAKVYISSTRAADDPLRFDQAELKAMATSYPSERYSSNAFLTENAEGILCVAILCASVAASLAQLRHIKCHPDVAPYVSLAMLGAQALGHGATLVTDARMLPAWPWPQATRYGYHRDDHHGRGRLLRWPDMDCSVKALALAALLLTLRLAHKVRRARARARARAPLEPGRVPGGDSAVLLCSLGVHLGVLLLVLAVPWLTAYGTSKATLYAGAAQARQQGHSLAACAIRAERYVALVLKDWFLLPQVIGNALWRVNCKPLRKGYYAGVTGMWLLPRVYGFLGPAVHNVYYYSHPDEAQDDAMDFYAKASAVVVPLVAAALAVSVYLQQRWNYRILGWAMGSSKHKKLQHVY